MALIARILGVSLLTSALVAGLLLALIRPPGRPGVAPQGSRRSGSARHNAPFVTDVDFQTGLSESVES